MRKLTTILLAGVATLAFTACGGGGSSTPVDDGGTTQPIPTEPAYRVTMAGSPYKFTLTQDSYVISNMHCVNTALYDTDGNVMYLNQEVLAGDYLFKLTRKFTNNPEYDDAKGVFFSKSSNFSLESIQLGKIYSIPTRTRDLYQFNVSTETTYVARTEDSHIDIYDENLELMESHSTVFTLATGTYYILTSNYSCSSSDGSFDITEY